MLFQASHLDPVMCLTQAEAVSIAESVAAKTEYLKLKARVVALDCGAINVLGSDWPAQDRKRFAALHAQMMDEIDTLILAANARNSGGLN